MARRPAKRKGPTKGVKSGRGKLSNRALGPAADAFGKELAPLGKEAGKVGVEVGRKLLAAIKGMVWGVETIGTWLLAALSARLKGMAEGKIVEPNARIAVPAVQALVYSMQDEFIREMFANLIAADMNADKKSGVHPAFVELIKEMTPEDAQVFTSVVARSQIRFRIGALTSGIWQHLDTTYSFDVADINWRAIDNSLTNLVRLGLIEFREMQWPSVEAFEKIERAACLPFEEMAQGVRAIPEDLKVLGLSTASTVSVSRTGIYTTEFGQRFWRVCMNK